MQFFWLLALIYIILKAIFDFFVETWYIWLSLIVIGACILYLSDKFHWEKPHKNRLGKNIPQKQLKDFLKSIQQLYPTIHIDGKLNIDSIRKAIDEIWMNLSLTPEQETLFCEIMQLIGKEKGQTVEMSFRSPTSTGPMEDYYSDCFDVTMDNSPFYDFGVASNVSVLHLKGTSLGLPEIEFYFYPYIIIYRNTQSIQLFEWSDLSVKQLHEITRCTEICGEFKGATQVGLRYLYERVNGGPDRRYNYNPLYYIFRLYVIQLFLTTSFYLIVAKDFLSVSLEQSFNNYINYMKTQKQTITTRSSFRDFLLPNKEVASCFRQLIDSYGEDILKSKQFISILDDLRVFKERPYMRGLLKDFQSNTTMDEIISSKGDTNLLDAMIERLEKQNSFIKDEITETIAYINYGLTNDKNNG